MQSFAKKFSFFLCKNTFIGFIRRCITYYVELFVDKKLFINLVNLKGFVYG